jgi:hypothetical protein
VARLDDVMARTWFDASGRPVRPSLAEAIEHESYSRVVVRGQRDTFVIVYVKKAVLDSLNGP